MNAIYNSYLTGDERTLALESFEYDVIMNKLDRMYEMVCLQEANNNDAAELRVFAESGTVDDLAVLVEAAGEEAAEKKRNILTKIIDMIKGLIAKISSTIKGIFTKGNPEEEIKVDKEEWSHFNKIKTLMDNAKGLIDAVKSGNWAEAATKAKSLAAPAAAAAAITTAGVLIVVKRKDIKAKVDECDGWLGLINATIASLEEKIKNLPSTLHDAAKSAIDFIKRIASAIVNWVGKMRAKFGGDKEEVTEGAKKLPGDDGSQKKLEGPTDDSHDGDDKPKADGKPIEQGTSKTPSDDTNADRNMKPVPAEGSNSTEIKDNKLGQLYTNTKKYKRVVKGNLLWVKEIKTGNILKVRLDTKTGKTTKETIPADQVPAGVKLESTAAIQASLGDGYVVESTADGIAIYEAVFEDVALEGATDIFGYNLGYEEAVALEAAQETERQELADMLDNM